VDHARAVIDAMRRLGPEVVVAGMLEEADLDSRAKHDSGDGALS